MEELVARFVGDESDNDFVDEDELESDEDLRVALDSISSDRGNVDSPAPLTPSSEIKEQCGNNKQWYEK